MSKLFDKSMINGMELSNRFVRSATWEGMGAEDGMVTQQLIDAMVNLAQGEVGLIITSHAYVQSEGQAASWQIGVSDDKFIAGLRRMTEAVHVYESKIVLQLAHAGEFTSFNLTGRTPVAVAEPVDLKKTGYHVLTEHDLEILAAAYTEAARRAKEAGFDGVQIHAAHGYLLSQFLSPIFNRRDDQYGGDIKNRSRTLLQVFKFIRNAVGEDYPILVKLNCQDFAEGGLSLEDSVWVGKMLCDAGIDAIEISGGLLTNRKLSPSRPGKAPGDAPYYINEARVFKSVIDKPLILVGGIRSLEISDYLVNADISDYIALSRPLIKEPHLIKRWRSGNIRRAECKSDNRCFRMSMSGNGMSCDMKQDS